MLYLNSPLVQSRGSRSSSWSFPWSWFHLRVISLKTIPSSTLPHLYLPLDWRFTGLGTDLPSAIKRDGGKIVSSSQSLLLHFPSQWLSGNGLDSSLEWDSHSSSLKPLLWKALKLATILCWTASCIFMALVSCCSDICRSVASHQPSDSKIHEYDWLPTH